MPEKDLWSSPEMHTLLRAFTVLQTQEERRAFLEDLCTAQELRLMARRLQVAQMLRQGQTYDSIRRALPVSSATITRISTQLQFGQGGYQTVLDRFDAPEMPDAQEAQEE